MAGSVTHIVSCGWKGPSLRAPTTVSFLFSNVPEGQLTATLDRGLSGDRVQDILFTRRVEDKESLQNRIKMTEPQMRSMKLKLGETVIDVEKPRDFKEGAKYQIILSHKDSHLQASLVEKMSPEGVLFLRKELIRGFENQLIALLTVLNLTPEKKALPQGSLDSTNMNRLIQEKVLALISQVDSRRLRELQDLLIKGELHPERVFENLFHALGEAVVIQMLKDIIREDLGEECLAIVNKIPFTLTPMLSIPASHVVYH